MFPPRCCQRDFDFKAIRIYLPIQLATLYQDKSIEYRTADRVYCHNNACSAFLGAKTEDVAFIRCIRCANLTCAQCKAAAHPGTPCQTSDTDDIVLALAEENGWKRCPGCRHLVELNHGCFHMTCRCRYQFCYLCTERWKSCTCPQWEENRLLVRATEQVERRVQEEARAGGPATVPFVDYNALVAREVERLRVDHDCQHTNWQYRPGSGRCEHCNFMLPQFLLVRVLSVLIFHCD